MSKVTNIPIPQNPIGENFAWRDWFQKLSNKVFGSMGTQESTNVSITGGSIDNTVIGYSNASQGTFTLLQASEVNFLQPTPIVSGGTGANTASSARTNLGLGTMATQNTGWSGTFKTGDTPQKTVTVSNGVITSVA
jgi:hypothetical protein